METWKPIKGYEGLYEVSNYGRIKTLQLTFPRIRKTKINPRGYEVIDLTKNKKDQQCRIHRLVAQAFLPNPENKPEVNHIDCIKTNNHVSNLEWSTSQENMSHAAKNGLTASKQKNAAFKGVIAAYKDGKFKHTMVGKYEITDKGFNNRCVYDCVNGKRKSHKGHTFIRCVV
jgi:hypothetical protein